MPENNAVSWEAAIFCRYILSSLDRLFQCLEGLSEDQLNWHPPASNTNSIFALTVHTMGNAEESLVHAIYDQPSQRNREQEFAAKAQDADELAIHWQDLRERLQRALLNLSPEQLAQEHAHPRRGSITGLAILIIVARHCAEHLGQAELTRDLLMAGRISS
ncbi:MAG TPA: DinB family protein [Ktedonobacterales bacterium]|nr:DinB family protein [Ktedonobacterales bacterium]